MHPVIAMLRVLSLRAGPPTGRWEGELTGGAPSGHLGNPGHNVPLLGACAAPRARKRDLMLSLATAPAVPVTCPVA